MSVGTAAQLAAVMKSAEPGSWSKVTGNAAIRTEEATVASKADMLRVLHPRPIAAKKFRRQPHGALLPPSMVGVWRLLYR